MSDDARNGQPVTYKQLMLLGASVFGILTASAAAVLRPIESSIVALNAEQTRRYEILSRARDDMIELRAEIELIERLVLPSARLDLGVTGSRDASFDARMEQVSRELERLSRLLETVDVRLDSQRSKLIALEQQQVSREE